MTWALQEAAEFVTAQKEAAEGFGFMLAIYGSVLERDDAKDLDLIAVPWRHGAHPLVLVTHLCATLGARIADHTDSTIMGSLAYALVLPSGQVVDIQFRGQARLCPACGNAAV